jgi:hypothetical protein
LSWRWIFFVNVPLGLLALAAGPWVLAKTIPAGAGVPDLFGALCLVLGIGALVWALIELPVASSGTKVVLATVAAGCAMAVAIWRSLRHPSPALDLAAVRVLPMWSSCLAMLLFAAAFGAMLLGSVMLLTTVWGKAPDVAGLCLSPGPVVVVIVSLTLAGRLISRIGVGAVAATGATLYVIGIVIWLCRVGPHPDYVADFLPGQLFTGAGVGLVFPSLSAVTGLALPAHRWGAGSALTNTARQLGTVLGTAVLTMIYQPGIDLSTIRRGWGFIAAAAGAAALIGAALALWRTTPADKPPRNDEIPSERVCAT